MIRNITLLGIMLFAFLQLSDAQRKKRSGEFYYKIKTYDRAIKAFVRELKKDPDNEEILYQITDSYLNSNLDRGQALPYAEKLIDIEVSVPNLLLLARSYFYANDFYTAIEYFEQAQLQTEAGSEEYKEAQKYIDWLMNAQAFKNNPLNVSFINLGKKVNTSKNELNPMVSGDDKLLIYSSNKRYHSHIGIYFYNICVSHNQNLNWLKPKTIGSTINSGYDEIVSGLTPNGKKLFLYHNRDWIEQIGFSNYLGNYKFTRLEPFDERWNKKAGTFGVWQSSNQDTLLFVGETERGDTDILYMLRLPNGELGEARPIPGAVNTDDEENFPVLSADGKRLYFSSNCSASMGGFDLFYSEWNDEKMEWGNPVNLGYPINDTYDNFTISHIYSSRYAYVAAIRPEGYGERDVYKVVFNEEAPADLILRCNALLETDSGNIVPPYRLRAELTDSVSGTLLGKYTSSKDSAKFLMAVEPGKYMLNFYTKDSLLHSTPLTVPELLFGNVPYYREFLIPELPKEED